mmetsp:Transcript_102867/g.288317  ORF Transcript_102867/g.288317 Transcript_102867/m.288317 type:complete len:126 (+) Transcript_102867:568-945(+)
MISATISAHPALVAAISGVCPRVPLLTSQAGLKELLSSKRNATATSQDSAARASKSAPIRVGSGARTPLLGQVPSTTKDNTKLLNVARNMRGRNTEALLGSMMPTAAAEGGRGDPRPPSAVWASN